MGPASIASSDGSVDSWNSVTQIENNAPTLSTDSPAFGLLHEESKRQTKLLEHMSKLAEEYAPFGASSRFADFLQSQLTLQHELVRLARSRTVGEAQVCSHDML